MSELTIIRHALQGGAHGSHVHIHVPVDRLTLAKRRWRGVAEDGREFGFDLDEPLEDGDHFHREGDNYYVTQQAPEKVLEITFTTPEQGARVGWGLGNLHFGVEVVTGAVRVADDPAVRQFLQREGLAFRDVTCVFAPPSAAAHHHHHDSHAHGHEHTH